MVVMPRPQPHSPEQWGPEDVGSDAEGACVHGGCWAENGQRMQCLGDSNLLESQGPVHSGSQALLELSHCCQTLHAESGM